MISNKSLAIKVKKLLKDQRQFCAPIDIFLLIRKLGIECQFLDMDDEMSGMLKIDGTDTKIGINKNHHLNRQRFTAAHELGHYILHSDISDQFIDRNFIKGVLDKQLANRKMSFNRDLDSASGSNVVEIEANRYAANILMPSELIDQYIDKFDIDPTSDKDVLRLSRYFNVSSQAMALRLGSLGKSYF